MHSNPKVVRYLVFGLSSCLCFLYFVFGLWLSLYCLVFIICLYRPLSSSLYFILCRVIVLCGLVLLSWLVLSCLVLPCLVFICFLSVQLHSSCLALSLFCAYLSLKFHFLDFTCLCFLFSHVLSLLSSCLILSCLCLFLCLCRLVYAVVLSCLLPCLEGSPDSGINVSPFRRKSNPILRVQSSSRLSSHLPLS
jgi:hypothetical protein